MQSLMSRIHNQIQSEGVIYYESYFYKESGMEGGKSSRSRNGKSYIDKSVSLLIGNTKKGICKDKTNGAYIYRTNKPKGCQVQCMSCLDCTSNDCYYG